MQSDRPAASPLDPFITQVLEFVAQDGELPIAALAETCGRQFNWLPGFCDVIVAVLKTNGLIVVYEWEPGKIQLTKRGQAWLSAYAVHAATD